MHDVAAAGSIPVTAHVSYGSSDGTGGAGGWQVKQTVGTIDPTTLASVTARMPTSLEPTFPMPEYPVDGLPRRLLLTSVGANDPRLAVWHSYPSGRDASSRPGNVFTQCAILAPSVLRPSQLWGSADWLTPFGAAEMAKANLSDRLSLTTGLSIEAVEDFILDPSAWRIGTLAVILDAVLDALAGGPIVALQVEDPAEAANWIAATTLCTDHLTSRRIHSSSYERARNVDQWSNLQLHLVGVPAQDHAQLAEAKRIVVIDPAAEVSLGDPGGAPHQTARGDQIPVSVWSGLVMEHCLDPGDLRRLAAQVDEVRATLPDGEWEPVWPLALCSWDPTAPNRSTAQVLAASTPGAAASVPAYYEIVSSAIQFLLGGSNEQRLQSWDAVRTSTSGLVLTLATGVVAGSALCDPDWLGQPGNQFVVPADVRPTMTDDLRDAVSRALRALAAHPEFGVHEARAAMRAIDLVSELGWDTSVIDGRVQELCDRLVALHDRAVRRGEAAMVDLEEVITEAGSQSRSQLRSALLAANNQTRGAVLDLLGLTDGDFLSGPDTVVDGKVLVMAAQAGEAALNRDPGSAAGEAGVALLVRYCLEQAVPISAGSSTKYSRALAPVDLADLVDRFGATVPEDLIVGVAARAGGPAEFGALRTSVWNSVHSAESALGDLEFLIAPLSSRNYWSAYESAEANLGRFAHVVTTVVAARAQVVALVKSLARGRPTPTAFSDPDLPPLGEKEIRVAGEQLWASVHRQHDVLLSELVRSLENADVTTDWCLSAGRTHPEPLVRQLIAAALSGHPVDPGGLKDWVAAGYGDDRKLGRELERWLAGHDLLQRTDVIGMVTGMLFKRKSEEN